MLRRLINLLTLLSLLLFAAVAVLWVRSHFISDEALSVTSSVGDSGVFFTVRRAELARGTVSIKWSRSSFFHRIAPQDLAEWPRLLGVRLRSESVGDFRGRGHSAFTVVGFGWRKLPPNLYRDGWQVVFPYWLITVLCAVVPTIGLGLSVRGALRFRRGMCRRCGYDLRASPGRCPECGTISSTNSAA